MHVCGVFGLQAILMLAGHCSVFGRETDFPHSVLMLNRFVGIKFHYGSLCYIGGAMVTIQTLSLLMFNRSLVSLSKKNKSMADKIPSLIFLDA